MEPKFNFTCPDHPDEVIARIDPYDDSERDLYCTQCLFSHKAPQNLTNRLKKVDVFLNEVATLIKNSKPKNFANLQTPKDLSEILEKQSETFSVITQKLETEKAKVEQVFDWLSSSVQEIITRKRKQYIELLDNQIANFAFQYSSLEKQIRKAYPTSDDVPSLYPTIEQLTAKLHDLKDTAGLAGFVRSLKQDLHELKSGNREEMIQSSIQSLIGKINNAVQTPPSISDFDYKAEIGKLENFVDGYLSASLQLENAVEGPQPIALSKGISVGGVSGSFVEMDPSRLSVTVSSSVNGGGTGKEYPKNLLNPGNADWNKWYTTNGGEQWIKVDLKEPKLIKMYGVKSANDCDWRDPYSWKALGKTLSGDWEVFHEVKGIKFNRRYEFKYFAVNPEREYTEIQIKFDKNRSIVEKGHWNDGLQLAEVSLFESKN